MQLPTRLGAAAVRESKTRVDPPLARAGAWFGVWAWGSSVLTLTISALSIGTAVLWAQAFNRRNEVQAGDSVWHDTIGTKVPEHGTHVDVEMRDGRIVSGLVDNYDGIPAGATRDLALTGKMTCFTKDGLLITLPAAYVVIPESEIVSIAVRHVPDQGRVL